MFPNWLKSPRRSHHSSATATAAAVSSPRSPRHFSCCSFKDIQDLLKEEQDPLRKAESTKRPSIFHRIRSSPASILRSWTHRNVVAPSPAPSPVTITIPFADPRTVVVYFTSLRVVRRTFEDCRTVRSILRGFRVPIDERDLSMDARFVDELQAIFGSNKNSLSLPRVFIGGRYVGGAEEIKQMHESGQLRQMIAVLPFADSIVCDLCGGLRFVLCERCNGSHKIYSEKSDGFRTCNSCNSYGLIRCPSCCPVHRRRTSS